MIRIFAVFGFANSTAIQGGDNGSNAIIRRPAPMSHISEHSTFSFFRVRDKDRQGRYGLKRTLPMTQKLDCNVTDFRWFRTL